MSYLKSKRVPLRTLKDLEAASKKIAEMFQTDAVIVMGSQAILTSWGNKAPDAMRTSAEIDIYPGNWRVWEEAENRQAKSEEDYVTASELIFSVAGEGSSFDDIYGFYLDGIDANTSPLPYAWQKRAVYKEFKVAEDKIVTAVSPAAEDMIASKLMRSAPKDLAFVEAAYNFRPFDIDLIKERLRSIKPYGQHFTEEVLSACVDKAVMWLDSLQKKQALKHQEQLEKQLSRYIPDMPPTHCAFFNAADNTITVRKWNPDMNIYFAVDNPMGPAIVGKNKKVYALDGELLDENVWADKRTLNDVVELKSPF